MNRVASLLRENKNLSTALLAAALAMLATLDLLWQPLGPIDFRRSVAPWPWHTLYGNAPAIHGLQILLIALNFATFAYMCARLTKSYGFAAVCAAVAVAALQIHKWNDAIGDDSLVMPFVAEVALVTITAANWRRSIASVALSLIGAAALTAMAVYDASFHASAWSAIAVRFAESLPGSYRVLSGLTPDTIQSFVHDGRFDAVPGASLLGWAAGIAAGFAAWRKFNVATCPSDRACAARVLAIAAALWAIPALLNTGYIGYFGFALFAVYAICAVIERNAEAVEARRICAAALGLAVLFFIVGNSRYQAFIGGKRHLSIAALQATDRAGALHLFSDLPADATIAVGKGYPYLDAENGGLGYAADFLYRATGRRFKTIASGDLRAAHAAKGQRNIWILTADSKKYERTVSLQRWTGTRNGTRYSDRLLAYQYLPDQHQRDETRAAYILYQTGRRTHQQAIGEREILLHSKRTCGDVPLNKAFLDSEPQVVWKTGFYRRMPGAPALMTRGWSLNGWDPDWRYAADRARIVIVPTCAFAPIHFVADVYAGAPAQLTVSHWPVRDVVPVSQEGTRLDFTVPATRLPYVITLKTDAPAVAWDTRMPRYDYADYWPVHMLVVDATATNMNVKRLAAK